MGRSGPHRGARPDRRGRGPSTPDMDEQGVESCVVTPASESPLLSDVVGNTELGSSLAGSELGEFGALIASEQALSAAGIDPAVSGASSNAAMLRKVRHATAGSAAVARLSSPTGGTPLPAEQLERFNNAFGHDFSHVRVHVDSQAAIAAQELNAHAFAIGSHIWFGNGEWTPGSRDTDRLLAHELTHVVQADEGRLNHKTGDSGVSDPSDPAEQEAYANEDRVLSTLESQAASADGTTVLADRVHQGEHGDVPAPIANHLIRAGASDPSAVQHAEPTPAIEAFDAECRSMGAVDTGQVPHGHSGSATMLRGQPGPFGADSGLTMARPNAGISAPLIDRDGSGRQLRFPMGQRHRPGPIDDAKTAGRKQQDAVRSVVQEQVQALSMALTTAMDEQPDAIKPAVELIEKTLADDEEAKQTFTQLKSLLGEKLLELSEEGVDSAEEQLAPMSAADPIGEVRKRLRAALGDPMERLSTLVSQAVPTLQAWVTGLPDMVTEAEKRAAKAREEAQSESSPAPSSPEPETANQHPPPKGADAAPKPAESDEASDEQAEDKDPEEPKRMLGSLLATAAQTTLVAPTVVDVLGQIRKEFGAVTQDSSAEAQPEQVMEWVLGGVDLKLANGADSAGAEVDGLNSEIGTAGETVDEEEELTEEERAEQKRLEEEEAAAAAEAEKERREQGRIESEEAQEKREKEAAKQEKALGAVDKKRREDNDGDKKDENDEEDERTLEELEEERDRIEAEIERVNAELERIGLELEETQLEVEALEGEITANQEAIATRESEVQALVAKAQKRQETPPDPSKDTALRTLQQEGLALAPELKTKLDEREDLEEEREPLDKELEGLHEQMEKIQQKIQDKQPKGGGGGKPRPRDIPAMCMDVKGQLEALQQKQEKDTIAPANKIVDGDVKAIAALADRSDAAEGEVLVASAELVRVTPLPAQYQARLSAREQQIAQENEATKQAAEEAEEAETATEVNPAADPQWQNYKAMVALSRTQVQSAQQEETVTVADHKEALGKLKESKTKKKDHEKRVNEGVSEKELLQKAIDICAAASSYKMLLAIPGSFPVTIKDIFLAPGSEEFDQEETGLTGQDLEDYKKARDAARATQETEREATAQAQLQERAAKNGNKPKVQEGIDKKRNAGNTVTATDQKNHAPTATPEPDKPPPPKETAVEKARREEEELALKVSDTLDTADPSKLDLSLKQIGDSLRPTKTPAQLRQLHKRVLDKAIQDEKVFIDDGRGGTPNTNNRQDMLQAKAEQRKRVDKVAMTAFGAKTPEEARQRMYDEAHARGKTPEKFISHMMNMDEKGVALLSPEMKQARQRMVSEHGGGRFWVLNPGSDQAKKDGEQARIDEEKYIANKKAAETLGSTGIAEADASVRNLAKRQGMGDEAGTKAIRDALAKPEAANRMVVDPKGLKAELDAIQGEKDPAKKAAAMNELLGRVNPRQVVGLSMAETESGPEVMVTGWDPKKGAIGKVEVAGDHMKQQYDAIMARPIHEQLPALCNMSNQTDMPVWKIGKLVDRKNRNDRVVGNAAAILGDKKIKKEDNDKKLREFAAHEGLDPDLLIAAAKARKKKVDDFFTGGKKQETKGWQGMSEEKKAHWKTLGWTEDKWKDGPVPMSAKTAWWLLDDQEKVAAIALGFDEDSWDDEEIDDETEEPPIKVETVEGALELINKPNPSPADLKLMGKAEETLRNRSPFSKAVVDQFINDKKNDARKTKVRDQFKFESDEAAGDFIANTFQMFPGREWSEIDTILANAPKDLLLELGVTAGMQKNMHEWNWKNSHDEDIKAKKRAGLPPGSKWEEIKGQSAVNQMDPGPERDKAQEQLDAANKRKKKVEEALENETSHRSEVRKTVKKYTAVARGALQAAENELNKHSPTITVAGVTGPNPLYDAAKKAVNAARWAVDEAEEKALEAVGPLKPPTIKGALRGCSTQQLSFMMDDVDTTSDDGNTLKQRLQSGVDPDDATWVTDKLKEADSFKDAVVKGKLKDEAATTKAGDAVRKFLVAKKARDAFRNAVDDKGNSIEEFRNMSYEEAGRHVEALAPNAEFGGDVNLVIAKLKEGGGENSASLLKQQYKDKNGVRNPAVDHKIREINGYPPHQRVLAARAFSRQSGIPISRIQELQKEVHEREQAAGSLHYLKNASPEKQKQVRLEVAKKLGFVVSSTKTALTPDELREMNDKLDKFMEDGFAQTGRQLAAHQDLVDEAVKCKVGDVEGHVKRLALQTGKPEAEIRRYIESQRESAGTGFGDVATQVLTGPQGDALRSFAFDSGKSLEQTADMIIRLNEGDFNRPPLNEMPELKEAWKRMKAAGLEPQYGKLEKEQLYEAGIIADRNHHIYKRKRVNMDRALKSGDPKAILSETKGMSPAQLKLFKEDYDDANGAGSLEAKMKETLDKGSLLPGLGVIREVEVLGLNVRLDNTTGALNSLKDADRYNRKDALGSVDTSNGSKYAKKRDSLIGQAQAGTADMTLGGDRYIMQVTYEDFRSIFMSMTVSERAQFVKDYQLARTEMNQMMGAEAGADLPGGRNNYTLPSLENIFKGYDENEAALSSAKKQAAMSMTVDPVTGEYVHKDVKAAVDTARQVDIGRKYAAQLNKGKKQTDPTWIDPRFAYRTLDTLGKQNGYSATQMYDLVNGRVPKEEGKVTPKWLEKHQDSVATKMGLNASGLRAQLEKEAKAVGDRAKPGAGKTRAEGGAGHIVSIKVAARVSKLDDFLEGELKLSSKDIVGLLKTCNPKELAALQAELGEDRFKSLADKVSAEHRASVNAAIGSAKSYNDAAPDEQVLMAAKSKEPGATADPSTPEGFAQKMAWAKDLPPRLKVVEMQKLMTSAEAQGWGPQQITAAMLGGVGGPRDDGKPQFLSPAMTGLIAEAERMPSHLRDARLCMLIGMTAPGEMAKKGKWVDGGWYQPEMALRKAAMRSKQQLSVAAEYEEIRALPTTQRLEKLEELSKKHGLTTQQITELHTLATEQGVLKTKPKPVSKEVADQIAEIRKEKSSKKQAELIEALQKKSGVEIVDIVAHIQQQNKERKRERELDAAAKSKVTSIEQKLNEKKPKDAYKLLRTASADPEELRRICKTFPAGDHESGLDALIAKIKNGKSDSDLSNEQIEVLALLKVAEVEVPELPPAATPEMSQRLMRLRRSNKGTLPTKDREAFRIDNNLSAADMDALEKHAEANSKIFDIKMDAYEDRLDAICKQNVGWGIGVSDDDVMAIIDEMPLDMIAEMAERNPAMLAKLESAVWGAEERDIRNKFETAKEIAALPEAKREAATKKARLDYKQEQLRAEFESLGGMGASRDRVKRLLKDCSPDEFAALNEAFDGELSTKLDKALEPKPWEVFEAIWHVVKADQEGTQRFLNDGDWSGLLGGVEGLGNAYAELTGRDAESLTLKAGIRRATEKNADGKWAINDDKINESLSVIRGDSMLSGLTPDSAIYGAIVDMNPGELMKLKAQFEENGEVSLESRLREILDGDELAGALAEIANASDIIEDKDRKAEKRATCERLALLDRINILKKDPKNAKKTDSELYELAKRDKGALEKATQARIKKINDGANAIFMAIDGWGDDVKALQKTVAGLTPEELELVKIEYRRHYGKDMETHIVEDLGWYDSEEAETTLKMMNQETRVEGLREFFLEYSYEWGPEDEELVFEMLEGLSVEERTKLVTDPGAGEFLGKLKMDLGDNEDALVDAYLRINPKTGKADAEKTGVAAAKMKIAMHGTGEWDFSGWGTDEKKVLETFDELTPAEVQKMRAYYNDKLSDGSHLEYELMNEFTTSDYDFKVIEAELEGDKVKADVMRLRMAAQDLPGWVKWGLEMIEEFDPHATAGARILLESTDEQLLEKTLTAGKEGRGGRSPDHLSKVRAQFNTTFGGKGGRYESDVAAGEDALMKMIAEETTGETSARGLRVFNGNSAGVEREYFEQLATKGEADDELTLLVAMEGSGTDEAKVNKILSKYYDKSPEERARLGARFQALARELGLADADQTLEEWVDNDFGGKEAFDLKLKLMGKPTTPQEHLKAAKMRFEFERGGLQMIGNMMMDAAGVLGATSTTDVLLKNSAELMSLFDENGKLIDPASKGRLEELAEWQAADTENYGKVRDDVADAVSNAVAAVATVAVVVLTGGLAAGPLFAIAAATVAMKAAIKGSHYSLEEAGVDAAMLAVDAVMGAIPGGGAASAALKEAVKGGMSLAKAIAKVGWKVIAKELAEEALKAGVESFAKALINGDEVWAQGDAAFLKHLAMETGMGALRGGITHAAGMGLSLTKGGMRLDAMEDAGKKGKNLGTFGEQLKLKAGDEILKAALGTALDHNQWEQWAKGDGVDGKLLKGVLADPLLKAVGTTAGSRSKFARSRALSRHRTTLQNTNQQLRDIDKKLASGDLSETEAARLRHERDSLHKSLPDLITNVGDPDELGFDAQFKQSLLSEMGQIERIRAQLEASTNTNPAHARIRGGVLAALEGAQRRNAQLLDDPEGALATLKGRPRTDGEDLDAEGPRRRGTGTKEMEAFEPGPATPWDGNGRLDKTQVMKIPGFLDPDTPAADLVAPADRKKLAGGDPDGAAEVFADPVNRAVMQDRFQANNDSPDAVHKMSKDLVETFGGDFSAAHAAFDGDDTRVVRDALNEHREGIVGDAMRQIRRENPEFDGMFDMTDPSNPVLRIDPKDADELDRLRAQLGGDDMHKLGIKVEVAEADTDPTPLPQKPAMVQPPAEETPVVKADGTPKKTAAAEVDTDDAPHTEATRRIKSAQDIADGSVDLKTNKATDEELARFKEDMGHRYERGVQFAKFAKADHPELFKDMSEAEIVAVWGYTTNDYSKLNGPLRSKDPAEIAKVEAYIKAASSGLAKMPGWEGISYRGSDLPDEVLAKYKPGEMVTEEAFTSTAATRDAKFDGNAEFIIEGRTGRDVSGVSEYENEKEILFRPGTRFEVTSKEVVDGKTIIKMREVPDAETAAVSKPARTDGDADVDDPPAPPSPAPKSPAPVVEPAEALNKELWSVEDDLAAEPGVMKKHQLEVAKDALDLASDHSNPKVKQAVVEVLDVDDPKRSEAIADILRDADDDNAAIDRIRGLKKSGTDGVDEDDLFAAAAERHDELFSAPKQAEVDAAKRGLEANDQVTHDQGKVLIEDAVAHFRKQLVDEGGGTKDALDAPNLGGYCGLAQGSVGDRLLKSGVHPEELAFHQTKTGNPDAPFAQATEHYFTVAKMPGDKPYLVDPTFAQFLHQDVGKRLAATPEGRALALELTTKGYAVLTPEIAQLYGKALTGSDNDFSVNDFYKPTKDEAHGGLNEAPSTKVHSMFGEGTPDDGLPGSGAPGSARPDATEDDGPVTVRIPDGKSSAMKSFTGKDFDAHDIADYQVSKAQRELAGLPDNDRTRVQGILDRAKSPAERSALLKAVASKNPPEQIAWLQKEIELTSEAGTVSVGSASHVDGANPGANQAVPGSQNTGTEPTAEQLAVLRDRLPDAEATRLENELSGLTLKILLDLGLPPEVLQQAHRRVGSDGLAALVDSDSAADQIAEHAARGCDERMLSLIGLMDQPANRWKAGLTGALDGLGEEWDEWRVLAIEFPRDAAAVVGDFIGKVRRIEDLTARLDENPSARKVKAIAESHQTNHTVGSVRDAVDVGLTNSAAKQKDLRVRGSAQTAELIRELELAGFERFQHARVVLDRQTGELRVEPEGHPNTAQLTQFARQRGMGDLYTTGQWVPGLSEGGKMKRGQYEIDEGHTYDEDNPHQKRHLHIYNESGGETLIYLE